MNEVEEALTPSVDVETSEESKSILESKCGSVLLFLGIAVLAAAVLWFCFFSGITIPGDH